MAKNSPPNPTFPDRTEAQEQHPLSEPDTSCVSPSDELPPSLRKSQRPWISTELLWNKLHTSSSSLDDPVAPLASESQEIRLPLIAGDAVDGSASQFTAPVAHEKRHASQKLRLESPGKDMPKSFVAFPRSELGSAEEMSAGYLGHSKRLLSDVNKTIRNVFSPQRPQ